MSSKVMGVGDVLRCLARSLIWRPVAPGEYQSDVSCGRGCVSLGKLALCVALREVLDREDFGRRITSFL